MKKNRKHIRIMVLMITSQVLLTVFVFQWIKSQYKNENDKLAGDLFTLYLDAQDQVIDTLLFKNYVGPVLQHKDGRSVMISVEDSALANPPVSEKRKFNGSENISRKQGNVMFKLTPPADSISVFPDSSGVKKVNNDFILRSVKMIVSHSGGSGGNSSMVHSLRINPDTAVFRKYYVKKLENKGMKFNLRWEGRDTSARFNSSRMLHVNPSNLIALPGMSVTRYQGYILKQMFPQIIFGAILVLITAMAFLFSFRSLREHIIFNDMKNEFISNMTHELKTPVATIGIALESLGKYNMKNNPEVFADYLSIASSETKRLEELVNRVLDHSVLEETGNQDNMQLADINLLLKEISAIMQTRLDNGIVRFEKCGSAESRSENIILCDPLLLKGVIMNLVDNSIKYCDKTPEIIITLEREKENIIIKVADNGPGIPSEYKTKIFEKFFRLPAGNIHNVKGYGLGLSFASLVVKLHGGTITVRNTDPGCVFIVKLPIAT